MEFIHQPYFILIVAVLLIYFIALVLCIAFIFWMLIDAGKNDRFWWLFLMLFFPLLGSIAYYFKHRHIKNTNIVEPVQKAEKQEKAPKPEKDKIEIIVKK